MNCRRCDGQPSASESVSIRERIAAPAAKAIPAPTMTSPSCR